MKHAARPTRARVLHLARTAVVVGLAAGTLQCRGRDPALALPGPDAGPVVDVCAEPTNKPVAARADAIYYGTRAPVTMPLSDAQQRAVVGVTDTPGSGTFCSGTLIAARVVLTAAHCTEGEENVPLFVIFGPDDLEPELVAPVDHFVTDRRYSFPEHDTSVLVLADAPADAIDVEPIPIAPASLDAADIGTYVENAGYGTTQDDSHGRYFVTELFDGFEGDQFIVVNGQDQRGVCFGDSGGPTLALIANGGVRVFGTLSWGDGDCTQRDRYMRVDVERSFIEQFTGPTDPGAPLACGDVDEVGTCDPNAHLATRCDGGTLVRDMCGGEEACAITTGAAQCVTASTVACGDVGSYGGCTDEVLQWCDNGNLRTRDCASCSERCLLVDQALGYACVPSDCGDLDHTGSCEGTVSAWCDLAGQRAQYDCADDGQTCAYLGEVLGYYCYDAVACAGLDFLGECDGSVLRWCEDNEVQEVDCADDGTACTYFDADVGYICQ